MTSYVAPAELVEALGILAERRGRVSLLAGGTDLVPRLRQSAGLPDGRDTIVNLKRIEALRGFSIGADGLALGALTTVTTLRRDESIATAVPLFSRTADRFASEQVRNAATIGGNVVNASPAGDLQIPLLVHGARARLASARGARTLAIADVLLGPGKTALAGDEILVGLDVPLLDGYRISFSKFGLRPAMEIAVVSVGVALRLEDGRISDARIALGAVAPTARRSPAAEAVLTGQRPDREVLAAAGEAALGDVSPIDDVRASADYRRHLVRVMTRRTLADACAG
ncbi:MAG: FAD binding domain-containing protein [Deltaproteobacteria bacterium]|nr:FAD binding domain-containing protein [Deltaproteobacteria bacterium]